MAKNGAVFIAGGAGYIGSHIAKMVHESGYHAVVYDNLSHGNRNNVPFGEFIEGDLSDKKLLNEVFSGRSFDCVIHFAALIDVGESVRKPLRYYYNNVSLTLNLLETMESHGVKNLIFSSSAAIYGLPETPYIDEGHRKAPINPYGHTKLMMEQIIEDVAKAGDLRYSCLRYFNAAGGDPHGEIQYNKRKESNLIPIALDCLIENVPLTIYGTDYPTKDGTCIRDYIHIEDLGSAHILAMEKLLEGGCSANYNLGNGSGFSVREVVSSIERVTGKKIALIEGARRPGDPPQLVADAAKAKSELCWSPCYSSLDKIILDACNARGLGRQ